MSRQFVHGAALSERLAVFSLILASTLAMAISIAPGIASADEAKSADELMSSDATPATIQTDAASLTQDGEGAGAGAPLAASSEEEVGIGQAETGEAPVVAGQAETGEASGFSGEPGTVEGDTVSRKARKADLAGKGVPESGDAGKTDERKGEEPGDAYDSEGGTLITDDVLDGATIRLRPQGSYKQVTVESDGSLIDDFVHLYNIGATSRFKLTKASDNSYHISYFDSYDAVEPHTREFYYLRPKNREALAKIHVNSALNSNATRWEFYQLDDGTYWIRNVNSGLYLSLDSLDNINANENALVQGNTRTKWEIEFVRGPESSDGSRNELKEYDSYSFGYGDDNGSVTVTSADWMSHLPDYAYLTDLSIPGVHDAGTVNVDGISGITITNELNPWRCQQLYIDDLLTNGVRYFDLRLALDKLSGKIVLQHGDLPGELSICRDRDGNDLTIETVMDWVADFLERHPRETVILAIKDEADNYDSSQAIYDYFDHYRQRHDNVYAGYGNPQLADVRGKIVLITRIDEYEGGRTYHIGDASGPAWAIYANWREGEDYAPALAASTRAYEFWTQDKYHITPDEKWKWIEGSILSDEASGAKGRHDLTVSRGKGAWVVSFTSTERVFESEALVPLDCARDINNRLKQSPKLSTDADEYVGIVCVDFMDEQMAQRIYAINFRVDLDNRQNQYPTFEGSYVQKTYGDDPFSYTATNTSDGGKISYRSENPDVATVDAKTGKVTIHGAGRVNIYADAAETNYYHSATAVYVLDVQKAAITVTASGGDVLYGDAVVCTYKVTSGSLKYDDNIDSLGIVATTDATAGSDVADYDVELSGGTGNPNYNVTLVDGKLTISPRPIAVTVTDKTATYNGSEQYGETACSFSNLLEGHTASITYTPSSGTNASAIAYDNGSFGHDFTVVDGNGVARTSNYSLLSTTPGKLTIGKLPVIFTGVSETKDYTGSKIEITNVTVDGLVPSHNHNVTFSAKGIDVGGPYEGNITEKNNVVIMSGDDDVTANYDITVANGSLTIQRNPNMKLSVMLEGKSFYYDGVAHALPEAATTNALSGKTVVEYSTDEASWTGDLASLTATNVGDSCTIYVRASNMNYGNTAYGTAALTIDPAKVTITVADASKVQHEDDPAFTGSVEGLVSAGDLGEIRYYRTNDDEVPGSYEGVLSAKYTPNPNYDVNVAKGDFTITALLTARWLDALGNVLQSATYAEGDPVPTYDGKEPTKASTAQYDYAFAGWDAETTDGRVTTFKPLFDATVRSYDIVLDLAGGVLDGRTGTIVTSIKYGATFVLPLPTRNGYRFLYWEGSHYNAGDKYLVKGDHTFTARWQSIADTTSGHPESTAKAVTPETGDESIPSILVLVIAALGSLLVLCGQRLRQRVYH